MEISVGKLFVKKLSLVSGKNLIDCSNTYVLPNDFDIIIPLGLGIVGMSIILQILPRLCR
jgi:hypothetical protein